MEKGNRRVNYSLAAVILALVLIGGGFGIYSILNSNQVVSTVIVDINPSIQFGIDKNKKVIQINGDTNQILKNIDLSNQPLNESIQILIQTMITQGILTEENNSILITLNSKDNESLKKELTTLINQILSENQIKGSIFIQNLVDNEKLNQLSLKHNVSKGKAQFINEIMKKDKTYTFEDLKDCSIHELNIIRETKEISMENAESMGQPNKNTYIGEQKAKEIALEYVNTTADKINNFKINLDIEDRKMIYEVEFMLENIEYDFDIDALNGNVLYVDKENEIHEGGTLTTDSNTIGKEQAKQLVFDHAKVTESQIQNFRIELDKENNMMVYEIEFTVGNLEYDYEVDAQKGLIIHAKVDNID